MAPSYVASTSGTSISSSSWSASKPAGTAAGHLMVALAASTGSVSGIGTPTGGATWTLLDSVSNGFAGARLYWKVAGSSEPSSYGFTQGSSNFGASIIVTVSDAAATEPQHAVGTSGSGTTVTTPSLTPVALGDLDLRFGVAAIFGDSVTFSPPSTYTERQDVDASGIFVTLATKTLTSTAATGAQNFTASTTPDARAGLTVLVTSPAAGQLRVVTSPTAVHRAATW